MIRNEKPNRTRPTAQAEKAPNWKSTLNGIAPSIFLGSVLAATLSVGTASAQTVVDTSQSTPLDITTDEDVTITVTGAIDVTSGADTLVEIDTGATDFSSSFTNDGEVLGTFTEDTTLDALARGVSLATALTATGAVVNNETVDLSLTNSGDADLYGFHFESAFAGQFANTNDILVDATSTTGSAFAAGLLFEGSIADTAQISNQGSIVTSATGAFQPVSVGALFTDAVDTGFTNSGLIESTALGGDSISSAYGLVALAGMTGDVEHGGSMTLHAEGPGQVTAFGYLIRGGLEGNFTSTGSIEATGIGSAQAYANGVTIQGGMIGDITNSSTLNVSAEGQDQVLTHGYRVIGTLQGNFLNSSTLTVLSETQDAAADARAYGIRLDGLTGAFSNTGAINVTSTGDAFGLYIENLSGEISEVGTIAAYSNTGDAYAIYLEDGTGTLHLNENDDVTGLIHVNGHDIVLTASSSDRIFYIEDADPDVGSFTTIGSDSGSVWFVDDQDDATNSSSSEDDDTTQDDDDDTAQDDDEDTSSVEQEPLTIEDLTSADLDQIVETDTPEDAEEVETALIVATNLDLAGLATSNEVVALYGSMIGNSRSALIYDRPTDVARGFALRGEAGNAPFGLRPFLLIDAQYNQFETISGGETNLTVFNGSAGVSGRTDAGLTFAGGVGAFYSDGSGNTTDFETEGVYIDAALGQQFGSWTLEAGLGYGWLSTDRERQIEDSNDASAAFDSTLLTALLAGEKVLSASDSFELIGFGEARYTEQKDDGYTESGSEVDATVSDVTTDVIEAKLGLEARTALGTGGVLKGRLSGIRREGLGEVQADVTVFSDTQSLDFTTTDFSGGSVEIGYELALFSGLQLVLNAEQEVGSRAQGPDVQAGVKWVF